MRDNKANSREQRRWFRRRSSLLLASVAAALAVVVGNDASAPSPATAAAPSLPLPPANGEMSFVVVKFHVAGAPGGDDKVDCPDGRGSSLRDSYLRTVSASERARLMLKENENELDTHWKAYGTGPNNGNVCSNINEFLDRPPAPIMKGPTGRGFDLDNDKGKGTTDSWVCKHDNLTSPAGEKGIDNQYWRVAGCASATAPKPAAGDEDNSGGFDKLMMTGEWTQVIILRGVKSLVNDPDVEVIYANTDDRPIADASGHPILNASFSVATAGRKLDFRNVLHGHIVNGVLTTDTKDILLSQTGGGVRTQFDLARGRLRLEFQADGTVKGMAGGYQPLLNVLNAPRNGGAGSVRTAGINCVATYNALRLMADGARDPKTGRCSRISYAYDLYAIPAFVSDVPPARRVSAR